VRWRDNPYSKAQPRWQLAGTSRWVWRAFLAVILAVLIAGGNYVGSAIYVALWVIGEGVALRDKRRSPRTDESGELGEDG
jgi:hypothetical protein